MTPSPRVYSYNGYTVRRVFNGVGWVVLLDGMHQTICQTKRAAYRWIDEYGEA